MPARNKKIRPGKGAKASILTKFIKPSEGVPHHGEKDHRTVVVLVKWAMDKNKKIFYYRLEGESEEMEPRYASNKWFAVLEEGRVEDVFDLEGNNEQGLPATEFIQPPKAQGKANEKGGFKEPKIKWKKLKARRLLYDDIYNGVVPRHAKDEFGKSTMKLEDIWQMHKEENEKYNRSNFSARVKAIQDEVNGCISRRDADYDALTQYIKNVPVSTETFEGGAGWQNLYTSGIDDAKRNEREVRVVFAQHTVEPLCCLWFIGMTQDPKS